MYTHVLGDRHQSYIETALRKFNNLAMLALGTVSCLTAVGVSRVLVYRQSSFLLPESKSDKIIVSHSCELRYI